MEKSGAPPLPKRLANALRMIDQRKAQSHCAEGGCAAARDTGDIDTVYDVIEQVQNLGNQHGEGRS